MGTSFSLKTKSFLFKRLPLAPPSELGADPYALHLEGVDANLGSFIIILIQ